MKERLHNLWINTVTQNTPNATSEGFLIIDKPQGKTSFFLVKLLKAITKIKKIGHTGTLDPLATGVMVLLLGSSYTRRADQFSVSIKEYEVVICFGYESNTYDADGLLNPISNRVPSQEEINKSLINFSGDIIQTVPPFSAKKVKGKKLYEYARKGLDSPTVTTNVNVSTQLIDYNYPYLTLRIQCSKGTYIRSIAHELGKSLAIGGYVHKLVRTKNGPYSLDDCISIDTICSSNFNLSYHLRQV